MGTSFKLDFFIYVLRINIEPLKDLHSRLVKFIRLKFKAYIL